MIPFEFDEKIANEKNAWLAVKFDSQIRRTIAGTSIESPFSYTVSAEEMTLGNHLIEFILIRTQSGIDEILASAEWELNVQNPEEIAENSIYAEVTSHSSDSLFIPGEDLSLIFEFDESAANAVHAKIVFMFDERTGEIPSPLVSPFVFDIPGRILTSEEHIQKFMLMNTIDGKENVLSYTEVKLLAAEPADTTENLFESTIIFPDAETLHKAGEEAVVTIQFDETAANEINAWLIVMFDEMNAATVFGTSINSPYTLDIPGKLLKTGDHNVKFLFMDKVNGTEIVISSSEIILKVID